MKLLMCLLIVVLTTYIGRLLSKRAAQRLNYFREYHAAFIYLTDKVVSLNLELCKALDIAQSNSLHVFFARCSKMLKSDPQESFNKIWTMCFERQNTAFLSKQDLSMVLAGGDAIETLCNNPSRQQADSYLKRLCVYIDEMEIDKRKKCKLYNTTGVLTGLFIALLVI